MAVAASQFFFLGVVVFERSLRWFCEWISILLCLPILALPVFRSAADLQRTAHLNRPARSRVMRSIGGRSCAQVGEFDFVHAITAYESLIDATCRETGR
jgi:hypothetical protein